MPKAKTNDVLPCGCVPDGKRCAKAQRLLVARELTFKAFQRGAAMYDDFKVAQDALDAHRKGK